jgi:uncharacterized protein (DUF934 family)
MPKLIKLEAGQPTWVEDAFFDVADEDPTPGQGGVILSLARFQSEGQALLDEGRAVGVRLNADEPVEALAYDLPRLAVVSLVFPKFRDGRQYSQASLLRGRYGYAGEIRAVGEVLREQGRFMVRCGFDAFAPADGSTPEDWAAVVARYRHVYQTAADGREPIFVERQKGAANA